MIVGCSAAAIAGVVYLAAPAPAGTRGWFGQSGCHGHGAPGEPDAQGMRHRVLYMAGRALDEIDVGTSQRETVLGIVGRAADDLAELQGDREELRAAFVDALLKPTVDREALEALRGRKLETIAAVSERLVTAVADVAEVLSVEQREKLAVYIRSRHEERWGHSHRL
jgi:Spy/CpxP family protein refolding chaperone